VNRTFTVWPAVTETGPADEQLVANSLTVHASAVATPLTMTVMVYESELPGVPESTTEKEASSPSSGSVKLPFVVVPLRVLATTIEA